MSDAAAVSALIKRTAVFSNSPDYKSEKIEFIISNSTIEKFEQQFAINTTYVAFRSDVLVGAASYAFGNLLSLFVSPEHQQAGIGSLLLHHIEDFAREQADVGLSLHASITAKTFYERRGYSTLGDIELGGGQVFFMRKRL